MTAAASLPPVRSLCVLPEARHRQALLAHPKTQSLSKVLYVAPSLEEASSILDDGVDLLVLSGRPALASLPALASRWPAPELILIATGLELRMTPVRALFPSALILQEPLDVGELVRSIELALCSLLPVKRLLMALVGQLGLKDVQQFARLVMVREALSRTRQNRGSAARLLQVTRPAVQQMVASLGLRSTIDELPAARRMVPASERLPHLSAS